MTGVEDRANCASCPSRAVCRHGGGGDGDGGEEDACAKDASEGNAGGGVGGGGGGGAGAEDGCGDGRGDDGRCLNRLCWDSGEPYCSECYDRRVGLGRALPRKNHVYLESDDGGDGEGLSERV